MKDGDKLLKRIHEDHVVPMPKWYFRLKNLLIWALVLLFVLIGAISFSVILFAIQQTDFSVWQHSGHSPLEMILAILPVLWLLLLAIFLGLAMLGIRNSKRGYRFSIIQLLAFSVSFSLVLGTLFFMTGGARKLEHAFDIRVSAYESIQEKKKLIWMNPEGGFLSGKILSSGEGTIQLEDFNGETWSITYGDIFIPPILDMEADEEIKMMGKVVGDHNFAAQEIRPWGGMKMMHKLMKKRKK